MKLKIGTRGSRLALWQANFIKDQIAQKFPELEIEIEVIKTTGDKLLDSPLSEIGGKGVFVKEIDDALLLNKVDIAVHSLKDVPSVLPPGLIIGAVSKRNNPSDAFVSKSGLKIEDLPHVSKVGTGSIRRRSQLLHYFPHLDVVPIRGNVDTRLKKMDSDGLDGVILAAAGLVRMGLEDNITQTFDPEYIVPAPGQGVIAVQCRKGDKPVMEILNEINDTDTEITSNLERSFLREIGGDCNLPAACYAWIERDTLNALALILDSDGTRIFKDRISGIKSEAINLGRTLASQVLNVGGEEVLEENKKRL